ncbi:MAG: PA0069 family radical SAM protein [Planctomycetes bacterium]|nr:PA0069 family radical SAM protein [Planctomycetota bacterium]
MDVRLIDNPPNPYESRHAEWLEPPPVARVRVYEEESRSILSGNDSPDLPYRWSVNPYRGCQHACSYCYARRTHEYLGHGAGTDFDTKLVAKVNAPELLRQAFSKRSWRGEAVHFSGVTDCYQPLEASYELTRRCLEVCLEFRNPACVVTKGFLVVRDAELLAKLNKRTQVRVQISIPFADAETCRLFEPHASSPPRRFEAIRRLRAVGLPVGVLISPVIPGLTDADIPRILEQAAAAGATSASYTALRLPGSVADVFVKRLREVMPLRADRVLNRLRDIHGGRLNDPRFGDRMRGHGPYWESIRSLFEVSSRRFGFDDTAPSQCRDCIAQAPCGAPRPVDLGNSPPADQLMFDF